MDEHHHDESQCTCKVVMGRYLFEHLIRTVAANDGRHAVIVWGSPSTEEVTFYTPKVFAPTKEEFDADHAR